MVKEKKLLKIRPRGMGTGTYLRETGKGNKKKCSKRHPTRQRRHAVKFCNLRKLARRSVYNLLGPGVDPGVVVVVRVGREPA